MCVYCVRQCNSNNNTTNPNPNSNICPRNKRIIYGGLAVVLYIYHIIEFDIVRYS